MSGWVGVEGDRAYLTPRIMGEQAYSTKVVASPRACQSGGGQGVCVQKNPPQGPIHTPWLPHYPPACVTTTTV